MKEIVFLNSNVNRWKTFEKLLLNPGNTKPDIIADLFIQITDDLAYARTYYPTSDTSKYLNNLALKAHQVIYRNKKEKSSRIKTFWVSEFPVVFHQNKNYFFYSLIIFLLAVLVGIISTANDNTFVRLILGDTYVNMTLENIRKGDPMAIYKHANQIDMFLGISINNIRVSFMAFVTGLFVSVGTALILIYNGIMLGCFQYFFYQQSLLLDSVLTIWIHGTLEIFAIIVSGGAGILIGNSILFPGSFSRLNSFLRGVKSAVKLIIGLIPIFLLAAFFEGFITRYTHAPNLIRFSIILGSLIFIVYYFFIYPVKILRRH
jgi:uncharacterized membrane protein SpoIIM required for sporulation